MPILLSQLLEIIPADTQQRVTRAKERANATIRESIRRETGLLLNRQNTRKKTGVQESVSVPIRLLEGLPTEIDDLEYVISIVTRSNNVHLSNIIRIYEVHIEEYCVIRIIIPSQKTRICLVSTIY